MAEIQMPWGAWYGDVPRRFTVPDEWELSIFEMTSDKRLSLAEIDEHLNALSMEVNSKLTEFDQPKVVVVVDDLTRPVILHDLLKLMVQRLKAAGISQDNITILIGLGSHQPLTETHLRKKLGDEIVNTIHCINHRPEDTIAIGVEWGKTEIKLNKHYLEADFKIVISGLTPHSFAGFSGGAKMLVPGLADMNTLAKTHKSVLMGFMGKLGEVEQNKFRTTIEQFVQKAGLDFFIGVVINGDRSLRDVRCGHFVDAHREASNIARAYCQTKTDGLYDLVISSAYPKDTELLQAENGLIPIKSMKEGLLKPGGCLVLLSACSEGLGHHGLFGPNGMLYRKPRPLRMLKDYNFMLFSDNISREDFNIVFNEDYFFSSDWQRLMEHLKPLLPPKPRVAVFPYGSMQLAG